MKATTVAGGSPDNPETEETNAPTSGPVPTETTPETEPAAEAATATEPAAEAAPEAEPAAEAATATATPAPRTETNPDVTAKPEHKATAKPAPEAEAEAGAQNKAYPKADPQDKAEPAAEAKPEAPAEAESEPSPKASADPEPAGKANAEPAAAPRPETTPEADTEPAPEAGTEAAPQNSGTADTLGADPVAKAAPEPSGNTDTLRAKPSPAAAPEAAPQSPGSADNLGTDPRAKPAPEPSGNTDTLQAEPSPAAAPEAAPHSSGNADRLGADPRTKPAPEPTGDADAPQAESRTAPGPEAEPKPTRGTATPQANPRTASAPAPTPEAGTKPASEPATGNADASGSRPKAKPAPEPATGNADASGSRPKAKPAPEPATRDADASGSRPKAKPAPEPATGNADASGSRPKAQPAPEPATRDADASGSRPKAQPAPEPATRDADASGSRPKAQPAPEPATGNADVSGSGPKAKPEGPAGPAAEPRHGRGTGPSEGPAGAGMARRAPSWAQGAESDSERTSQFIALKPLDTPTPTQAPASAPTPTPAPIPARTTSPTAPPPTATPAGATPAGATSPTAPPPTATPAGAGSAPVPLELLAELTNTAPPPETPRRTALRRVKIWTPILLVLAGGVVGAQLLRPLPAPKIVAAESGHTIAGQLSIPWPAKGQGAIRVPGSGDIGTFGEQKPVPTASVAKVMTAYVILKNHPLKKTDPGPSIKIDAKTVADGTSENESRIVGLTAGTEFSQQDMLKMLMIPSGNNVARLLARWDTGSDSEAAFVEKMNAAAKELGMTNTVYTDPSGLDAGTVSTATDQLKLAEAVMKDEVFRSIVAMPSAPITGLKTPLDNNNDLLNSSIRGIKTGSSTPAGGALMWAAYKSVGDETPLIVGTLMDQRVDGPDENAVKSLKLALDNSKKIIEAVRTALASAPVIRKGDTVGYVDDGLGGRTPLVAAKDLNVIGVPGQQLKLTLKPGASPLPHTAKSGTEVAVLTAGEGEGAKSVPVAVGSELAEPSFGTRLTRLG
ncbi:serine hydrolase [Streptomyces sp. NPDC058525]|uniref:D-alanyl-D-alanine carboxypeptidase family protein n=1 Tax=Streptomyces sp. NPDC058525 TaxID=3346538 RepID=UPI00365E097D